MLLEGIFPAITTPFYTDGRLYLRKLEQNVARYSLTAVSGLVVLGSTGEAVMLNDGESREVLRNVRSAAADEKVLLAGVGRESIKETLSLAEYAAKEGYDAVLVRTPNFYEPQMTAEAMLNYYRTIADHSALPVLIYSIPKFTHYDIPVEIVAELAGHPNIIGIKDSSGSVERIAAMVGATREIPKRTVTVTPVFAAVTGRMLSATVARAGHVCLGGSAWQWQYRAGSGASAAAHGDADPGSGLPGPLRRSEHCEGLAGRRCERGGAGDGRMRSAGLPRDLHGMERPGYRANGAQAAASFGRVGEGG